MNDGSEVNVVTIIAAVAGAGGLGAFFREIISGIGKISRGMSARESSRKADIVQERDEAIARASAYMHLADISDRNRRKSDEYAAEMRLALVEHGVKVADLPKRPVYENTMSRAELNRIIKEESHHE